MYLIDAAGTAGSGNGTPAPAPAPSPAPAGQPAAGEFKMPEKFASAKPEDIAKAYVELEGKLGEQGKKLGALSEYEKYGAPKDVGEAIQWARDTYAKIQRGELTPKQAAQQAQQRQDQQATQAGQAPWQAEGWDFLPPAEQAAKMAEFNQRNVLGTVMAEVQKIAQAYGQQIEGYRASQSREQSLMLQVLEEAMKSGGKVNIKEALEKAAELGSQPPEELIKLAIQNLTNPANTEAEIEKRVTARLAEEKQKRDNESLDNLNHTASQTPRFATTMFKNRNEENRSILENLRKNGINLG